GRMGRFLKRDVGWTIHSGSGRTAGDDDRTDLYPTRLAAESIRPGTVYADPYGHTLVVVQRLPQTPDRGGILLAVDAQPDGTIARKRYWRGNFLFAVDPALGGAGFKHFRPIVRAEGGIRPLSNGEITAALEEQVRTRVKSVANGEDYVASHPGTIEMPSGAAIFETSGAWEDYATPSRDLRLLIAIDVVRNFPE